MTYAPNKEPQDLTERDLSKEYDALLTDREPFLKRARDCALVTLPYIMPPSGHNGSSDLPTPSQSIGAQGVNNLANLLLESLFPPQVPFFRFQVDDQTLAEWAEDPEARSKVEDVLASHERTIKLRVDRGFPRASALTAFKHLIVAGNVFVTLRKDNTIRAFRLDQYVTRRDGSGNLLKAITREEVDPKTLPKDVREAIEASKKAETGQTGEAALKRGDVVLYTCWEREGNRMKTYQQVNGIDIEGSQGNWPLDKAPCLALRWSWQDGEDYGRSYCEEFLGDLEAADGLSRAIREATAAASRVIIMVAANGQTTSRDVSNARNLDIITGRAEDVTMLQLQKQADLQVAQRVLGDIIQRLSQMFVMHLGVRRDAERVTAEETRMVIRALEGSLGGTYALLALELQLPLVKVFQAKAEESGELPALPTPEKGGPGVTPQITTGVEALGRGEDYGRYSQFVESLLQTLGPEVAMKYINAPDLIKRMGASLNIDMKGLIKTPEQIQMEEQQAMEMQQQMMMQQGMMDAGKAAAPQLAKAATDG